jgi:hypothetical protein
MNSNITPLYTLLKALLKMSENMSINNILEEECESKLSLVIRKVQEGKTYICITNITTDRSRDIHIVITMNTLGSNMQFFGRMEETIGSNRIIVFNSKKKTATITETNKCHHAKDISSIFTLLRKHSDIKVIVCCAHEKRIRSSIPDLFGLAEEMTATAFANRKFIVHIDEAHKYIPENEENIRSFNYSSVVKSIIGYSGSPIKIWSARHEDPLFHKIHIVDVQGEFDIIRSPEYFGVNSCEHIIVEAEDGFDIAKIIEDANIQPQIPNFALIEADMTEKGRSTWYGERYCFDLGNEILFLSFLDYILGRMNIPQDSFSYNFVPAYTRKVTHYQTVEIIHSKYPKANVIVMNGNGMTLFRLGQSRLNPGKFISKRIVNDKKIRETVSLEEQKLLLEPAYMVQKLIANFANYPTFVTGQTCVGMSVTLINQHIGNFDNVVMVHQQFSADKLYQLCRFLFNYTNWSEENKSKIKKTNLYSLTKHVIDTCVKYEEEVEYMSSEFAGKTCSLREIQGLEPEEPSVAEQRKNALSSINLYNSNDLWKKFKVYDGNDEEQWNKVNAFYNEKMGHDIPTRSKPKQKDPKTDEVSLFYHCSTTGSVAIQMNNTIKRMATQSWWSTFQLLPDRLNYARIFVGYDSLEDPSEYTIYVKHAQLHDLDETREILSKYGKKSYATVSSSSNSEEEV